MNTAQPWPTRADLGGQAGHGRVQPEAEGETFHADWEARVLALTLAMGATGAWNIDMSRAAREVLPDYAQRSYYEIWWGGLLRLLLERGLVTPQEVATGRLLAPPLALPKRLAAGDVDAVLARGSPTLRSDDAGARFAVGERVRTRAGHVSHHTRLPGYACGRIGTVERIHGRHVYADPHAQGLGEQPQWLYTVVFDGAELWGDASGPGLRVSVDAWEPYLETA